MHVFCVGMYRAGSTWQYEVVSHLIERHRGGRRLGFVPGDQLGEADGWHALKAHEGHKHFAAALGRGRAKAVYCYRDLRDVAFSLAHVYRTSFEDIVQRQRYLDLCLANDRYWARQPRVLSQRYEAMIAEPAGAVTAIAEHLGIELADGEAAAVAGQFALEANRQRAAAWEQDVRARGINPDDPAHGLLPEQHTLLHWNHIREGRAGGWRAQATPRQRAVLAALCGPWLKARGYEKDDAWALEAVDALARVEQECQALNHERADLHERLARAEMAAQVAQEQLEELQRLGPVALGLAAEFHAVSLRFPRLREWVKRLLGFGRPARRVAASPGWGT